MRSPRGFTFVSFLLLVALAVAVVAGIAYGPAFIDRFELRQVLREGGNYAYREPNDDRVRAFVLSRLHQTFDHDVEDHGQIVRELRIDLDPDDLRIERTTTPPRIDFWVTWSHPVKFPFVEQERSVTFTDHVDQDLSAVKW